MIMRGTADYGRRDADRYLQGEETLCEGRGRHLDPALVAGVDLEVVPVSGVEPQQAESLGPSVLPWNKIPVSKY